MAIEELTRQIDSDLAVLAAEQATAPLAGCLHLLSSIDGYQVSAGTPGSGILAAMRTVQVASMSPRDGAVHVRCSAVALLPSGMEVTAALPRVVRLQQGVGLPSTVQVLQSGQRARSGGVSLLEAILTSRENLAERLRQFAIDAAAQQQAGRLADVLPSAAVAQLGPERLGRVEEAFASIRRNVALRELEKLVHACREVYDRLAPGAARVASDSRFVSALLPQRQLYLWLVGSGCERQQEARAQAAVSYPALAGIFVHDSGVSRAIDERRPLGEVLRDLYRLPAPALRAIGGIGADVVFGAEPARTDAALCLDVLRGLPASAVPRDAAGWARLRGSLLSPLVADSIARFPAQCVAGPGWQVPALGSTDDEVRESMRLIDEYSASLFDVISPREADGARHPRQEWASDYAALSGVMWLAAKVGVGARLPRLLAAARDWHECVGRDRERMLAGFEVDGAELDAGFPFIDPAPAATRKLGQVAFRRVATSAMLVRESAEMRHCIADYAEPVARLRYAVYAVQDDQSGERATLGVSIDPDQHVARLSGFALRRNDKPSRELRAVAEEFVVHLQQSLRCDLRQLAAQQADVTLTVEHGWRRGDGGDEEHHAHAQFMRLRLGAAIQAMLDQIPEACRPGQVDGDAQPDPSQRLLSAARVVGSAVKDGALQPIRHAGETLRVLGLKPADFEPPTLHAPSPSHEIGLVG